jgi:hypothetical protein
MMLTNNVAIIYLTLLAASTVFAADGDCWVGRNGVNTQDVLYHIEEICSGDSFVCQRLDNTILDLKEMSCALRSLCLSEQRAVENNASSWMNVICCDENLCNGYEGIGETADSSTSGNEKTGPSLMLVMIYMALSAVTTSMIFMIEE